ncbi:MAG: hypothetical protein OXI81_01880, partial [Paracoccaceae bacterium]|nr:hypothetical protein [Paracoccaceae bacterium]
LTCRQLRLSETSLYRILNIIKLYINLPWNWRFGLRRKYQADTTIAKRLKRFQSEWTSLSFDMH